MLAFYLSSVFKGIMGNDIDERTYRSPRIFSYGIKERRKPIDIDLKRRKRSLYTIIVFRMIPIEVIKLISVISTD